MSIKRIDFTVHNGDEITKMSLIYDGIAITKEQAEQIINDPRLQMNDYNNQLLKEDMPCFFLPTSHANMLRQWMRGMIKSNMYPSNKMNEYSHAKLNENEQEIE